MNSFSAFLFYKILLTEKQKREKQERNATGSGKTPQTGTITVFIHTPSGEPVVGTTITVDEVRIGTTNSRGVFTGTLGLCGNCIVNFEHPDFSPSQRTIFVEKQGSVSLDVTMLSNVKIKISSEQDAAVTIPGTNVTIEVSANSLLTENGEEYKGEVNVNVAYLDPNDPAQLAAMPGDFTAINDDGENCHLESYGAICLELKDSQNRNLVLKKGNGVKVDIPVKEYNDSASLWEYNTSSGKWVPSTNGSKFTGQSYYSSFNRVGWINCDRYFYTRYTVGSVSMNSSPVANATVTARVISKNSMFYAQTDSKGKFKIPRSSQDETDLLLTTTTGDKTTGPFMMDGSTDLSVELHEEDFDEEYKRENQREIDELEKKIRLENEELEQKIMEMRNRSNSRIKELNTKLKAEQEALSNKK